MSKNEIDSIQDFLTVVKENEDKKVQIVNVELLLRKHSPKVVIGFLSELHKDYTRKLQKIIHEDKTSSKLNEIIATKFRIKMAMNTIKNYTSEGGKAA